mgnify:CR=1 FL=1
MRIINVVGARPNFIKIAPLMRAYQGHKRIEPLLVHTGQHYDAAMSDLFFHDLAIPAPDINLEVGPASHAVQTAEIMRAFEKVVVRWRPDAVLVVGDVNSTIACGLVAAKLGVRLLHVEAGLRSFDRSMPEEINRLLTDAISDLLFCSEQSGVDNLLREGHPREKVHFVGNVMIDTLLASRDKAQASRILDTMSLTPAGYALLTLHRPSNVDQPRTLKGIVDALEIIQQDMPVVFPMHPRTRTVFESSPLRQRVKAMPGLRLTSPLGYLDFLKLMSAARVVLTDSGGVQEETTILGVPCLTLRKNTERPVTIEMGTNQLAGTRADTIVAAYRRVAEGPLSPPQAPPLWDGRAAQRIVDIIQNL